MYFVYILKSLKYSQTYVGFTSDFEARIKRHNSGQVTSTKRYIPWKPLFIEEFKTSSEAKKRELWWKSYRGRQKLKDYMAKLES